MGICWPGNTGAIPDTFFITTFFPFYPFKTHIDLKFQIDTVLPKWHLLSKCSVTSRYFIVWRALQLGFSEVGYNTNQFREKNPPVK